MLQIHIASSEKVVPAPSEGEVVVDIHASSLNFRCVLMAINMLPQASMRQSYFGPHMGMEAAGVISAVGPGVTDFKVGDRVVCSEPASFTNRLIASASRLIRLDDAIPMEVSERAGQCQRVVY